MFSERAPIVGKKYTCPVENGLGRRATGHGNNPGHADTARAVGSELTGERRGILAPGTFSKYGEAARAIDVNMADILLAAPRTEWDAPANTPKNSPISRPSIPLLPRD